MQGLRGGAQGQAIWVNDSAIRCNIRAVADRVAEQSRAKANEQVGEYYKEFDEHVDLRLFLDRLEATVSSLRERTTIIMDTAIAPFNLFDFEHGGANRRGASAPSRLESDQLAQDSSRAAAK